MQLIYGELYLFQVASRFIFVKSNLSDFNQVYRKKYINIYSMEQIHRQNLFHGISNEYSLTS